MERGVAVMIVVCGEGSSSDDCCVWGSSVLYAWRSVDVSGGLGCHFFPFSLHR